MKCIYALAIFLMCATLYAQTTVNIPIEVSVSPSGAATLTIPAQTVTIPAAPPAPAPPSQPPVKAFVIYSNGVFNWPGDFSYAATVNYHDTAGMPPGETQDIAVTTTAWGAWQPYATAFNFNRTGYTYLQFKLKPTRADSAFTVQFLKVGDTPVAGPPGTPPGGYGVPITKYGPALQAGVWGTYKVLLDDVLNDGGTILSAFYKFAIQSHAGTNDLFYIDDVEVTS